MGKKKGAKQADNYWDEDFENDLNGEGSPAPKEQEVKPPTKETKSKGKKKGEVEEEDDNEAEEVTESQPQLSKKQKKKANANQKKEEAKEVKKEEVKEPVQDESSTKQDAKKPTKKTDDKPVKKADEKPEKKKGGISSKMAEAIRKQKEDEEKRQKEEEERRKKFEEEEAIRLEQERIEEEEEKRKLDEKKKRKKENDAQKAKNAADAKAAAIRAQFAAQGMIVPTADAAAKPKMPYYGKKKPNKKKDEEKKEEQKEEAKVETPIAEAPKVEETKREEPKKVEEEETWESWEDAYDEEKQNAKKAAAAEAAEKKRLEDEQKKKEEMEREKKEKAEKAEKALAEKSKKKELDTETLRSPICCVLGHVDTGKTKLLDNLRRSNVQEGEAGGITQQIGATYFPMEALRNRTAALVEKNSNLEVKVPGLLLIDTPGHESFTNLRSRGSSLCDIAILVVDILSGLEQQTIESINLLKQKKIPFVVALNKVDRIYDWKSTPNSPIQDSLAKQNKGVIQQYETKIQEAIGYFAEQSLNAILYYKNKDFRKYVSIVPTSAVTGEGIPDLLLLLTQLTQRMMTDQLLFLRELQCTVLEVKVVEGLGTTIDVILVNGVLNRGDQIVVCGLNGPIVTTIRALLTPAPMKEIRVKSAYVQNETIRAAMGIKISAAELDKAVAGSSLLVVNPGDDIEELKKEVMADLDSILKRVSTTDRGVYVQSSTLGALEALLEFLKESKIPVSGINIGPVNKKDVVRASVMLESAKEYAVILAFDVRVSREAKDAAEDLGVQIFEADIIYHLFDRFTRYMEDLQAKIKEENAAEAVFPCRLRIIPEFIFNKKDPILVGVEVMEGVVKIGTPIVVPSQKFCYLGKITSIENNHKEVPEARKGAQVAIKIENALVDAQQMVYGRHFDFQDELVSRISRQSIDVLKQSYKSDLKQEDVQLLAKLKKTFGID